MRGVSNKNHSGSIPLCVVSAAMRSILISGAAEWYGACSTANGGWRRKSRFAVRVAGRWFNGRESIFYPAAFVATPAATVLLARDNIARRLQVGCFYSANVRFQSSGEYREDLTLGFLYMFSREQCDFYRTREVLNKIVYRWKRIVLIKFITSCFTLTYYLFTNCFSLKLKLVGYSLSPRCMLDYHFFIVAIIFKY